MDDGQLSLTTHWVELTDEEKVERGLKLANLIREAQVLDDDHAEQKKEMKKERDAIDEAIAELATVVRTGKEERPITRRIALPSSSEEPGADQGEERG